MTQHQEPRLWTQRGDYGVSRTLRFIARLSTSTGILEPYPDISTSALRRLIPQIGTPWDILDTIAGVRSHGRITKEDRNHGKS